MNTPLEGPSDHFNAYYQDNFLLIQFIITEFIQTHSLASEIKQISYQFLTIPYQSTPIPSGIFQKVNELMGGSTTQEHFPLSRWINSSLNQLKEHSQQFSCNTHYQIKSHVDFYLIVHQFWLATIHLSEIIHYLQGSQEKAPYFFLIKRAFQNFNQRFDQMTRLFPRIFRNYITNENVIYSLVRKKNQLVAIYGQAFLSKLLKKPLAPEKLLQLLLKRYQARGYDHILHSSEQPFILEEAIQ